jgi:endonuclease/exonuclease/phosphatase family metal-dependent hydrolase
MKLKILSWNIWCGVHLEKVIQFLQKADADIIALQEVCIDERGNIGEIIAKKLKYKYTSAITMDIPVKYILGYNKNDKRIIKFGTAILSKHKIINSKIYNLYQNPDRTAIQADIKINNKILHTFSIHLTHSHQKPSKLQEKQIDNLINILPEKDVVVMGDFNNSEQSQALKKISKILKNTEDKKQTPTWSMYKEGCTICLVDKIKHKLDYIFTSKELKTKSFKVYKTKASDHLPISCIMEI